MVRIDFDVDNFNTFLRCLTNLISCCHDVDIREGIVRQRTNDLTAVFEMDMTSILNEASIPITDLKKKFDLLKTFAGRDVTIEIHEGETESESYYILSDQNYYSIKFKFPSLQFMDNKFMSKDETDSIFIFDPDELILQDTLVNSDSDRIRVVTTNFDTKGLQIKFSGDNATICAVTTARDQLAKFKSDITTSIEFDGDYTANLSVVPFCIDHDSPLDFRMYKDSSQNLSYNQIKTDLGLVAINIYSRSAIISDTE